MCFFSVKDKQRAAKHNVHNSFMHAVKTSEKLVLLLLGEEQGGRREIRGGV